MIGVAAGVYIGSKDRKQLVQMPIMEVQAKEVTQSVDAYPTYTGIASFYSRRGCVGCSTNMRMANGQPLDDSRLTVAFNRAKLESLVRVTNVKNGQSVVARVTDTGGFERHGRIIDLTIATKNSIHCSHLCPVKVEVL
jgi:rare lipoprotein A